MLMLFPQRVLLQLKTNVKRRASCCSDEEEQEDLAVQSFYHCSLHLGARHSQCQLCWYEGGLHLDKLKFSLMAMHDPNNSEDTYCLYDGFGVYFILCNANRKTFLRRWWSWVGCLRVKYLRQLAWPGIEGHLSFPIRWFVIFYVVL